MKKQKVVTTACRQNHMGCATHTGEPGRVLLDGKWIVCECACHDGWRHPPRKANPPKHGQVLERVVFHEEGRKSLWRETPEGLVNVQTSTRHELHEIRWCSACVAWVKVAGEFEHALGLCSKCFTPWPKDAPKS